MHTPAHVVVNLLCLGRRDRPEILIPVVLGGVLPDAPMFLFYFIEKVILGTSEHMIWTQSYYQQSWQNLIDLFHSAPLIFAGWLISMWSHSQVGKLFFASMMLHILGDFPLHHDDAHHHFFPFSNWQFRSPVSYWDPHYYGGIFFPLEVLLVSVSCLILFRTYQSRAGKISVGIVGASYFAYFLYIFTVWV